MLWANKFDGISKGMLSTRVQILKYLRNDSNDLRDREYINYFSTQRTDISPPNNFRSSYFSHFSPHFSPPPSLPSIFHGSFLCAEGSPALVSTGNINFPRRGRSPSALRVTLVNNRHGFRTVFVCENDRFKFVRHGCSMAFVQWPTNLRRHYNNSTMNDPLGSDESSSKIVNCDTSLSFTRWTSLAISLQRIWSFLNYKEIIILHKVDREGSWGGFRRKREREKRRKVEKRGKYIDNIVILIIFFGNGGSNGRRIYGRSFDYTSLISSKRV